MTTVDDRVLVLNQDFQALTICCVQKSMILLILDKAELIHPHPTKKLHTVKTEFPFPSVIRLHRYAHVRFKKVILSRKNILRRDRNRCLYCGKTDDLTLDHVIPRSRGGADAWENLATACNRCNNRKGDRTPDEVGMSLHYHPYKPTTVLFLRQVYAPVSDEWKPYLYLS